jgi:hypothetical protein
VLSVDDVLMTVLMCWRKETKKLKQRKRENFQKKLNPRENETNCAKEKAFILKGTNQNHKEENRQKENPQKENRQKVNHQKENRQKERE